MARRSWRRSIPRLSVVAESYAEDRPRIATFIRGATIGALVGAVVAGSALLGRRGRAARTAPERQDPPDRAPGR
jgi:hypothetical protein